MFWSESGEKSAAFTRQTSSNDVRDDSRCTFSLRKSYYWLWTLCILVKNVDLFHLLSSPDDNWVLWIIVMFLSDSHSDGTHSHPLLRHVSPNLMKKQTPLHLRWSKDEHIWANYCFNQYFCNPNMWYNQVFSGVTGAVLSCRFCCGSVWSVSDYSDAAGGVFHHQYDGSVSVCDLH